MCSMKPLKITHLKQIKLSESFLAVLIDNQYDICIRFDRPLQLDPNPNKAAKI